MEKQIFKVGDRVFDHRLGWGEVTYVYSIKKVKDAYNSFNCEVKFDKYTDEKPFIYTDHGALTALSFTEYTLQGFTQEKPVNYEEYIGKWGKFLDSDKDILLIGKLLGYDNTENGVYPFENEFGNYANFEPLTEEQVKVLGL